MTPMGSSSLSLSLSLSNSTNTDTELCVGIWDYGIFSFFFVLDILIFASMKIQVKWYSTYKKRLKRKDRVTKRKQRGPTNIARCNFTLFVCKLQRMQERKIASKGAHRNGWKNGRNARFLLCFKMSELIYKSPVLLSVWRRSCFLFIGQKESHSSKVISFYKQSDRGNVESLRFFASSAS